MHIATSHRIAAVALGGAAAVAALGSSGALATTARRTAPPLTFVATLKSEATPDPSFPQPGDTEVAIFENTQHGRPVGGDRAACLVVDSVGNLQCTTTVSLPGGKLEVVYPDNLAATRLRTPIVGGTGRYARTRGYFSLRQIGANTFHVTLNRG